MLRRNFLQRLTFAGAGGLAVLGKADVGETVKVTYSIKGFTCVTCAVGLDTLLRQQKGVIRSQSSYPEAKSVIVFDPRLISESELKAFIAEMGFSVAEEHKG
ncbi:MAG TPA: heavy-metal-associated domain-containing protein [Bryobacteraceae bacterium]|nr:heavy-metal-associated domain-containing protein [Bryobacteraceae bacterium]